MLFCSHSVRFKFVRASAFVFALAGGVPFLLQTFFPVPAGALYAETEVESVVAKTSDSEQRFPWETLFPNGLISGNVPLKKANARERDFSEKCVLVYRRFGKKSDGALREMRLNGKFSREMTPLIVPVADPADVSEETCARRPYGFTPPWADRGVLKKYFGDADFALLDEDGEVLLVGCYTMSCFTEIESVARERLTREERRMQAAREKLAESEAARIAGIPWKNGLVTAATLRERHEKNLEKFKDGKKKLAAAYPSLEAEKPAWFVNATDEECGALLSSRFASGFSHPIGAEPATETEKKRVFSQLKRGEDFQSLPEVWRNLIAENVENFSISKNRGYTSFRAEKSFDAALKNGGAGISITRRGETPTAQITGVTYFSSNALDIGGMPDERLHARPSNPEHLLGWLAPARRRANPQKFIDVPAKMLDALESDDKRYAKKLIEVVNENLDYLGNTPMPNFSADENFWGKAFVSFGLARPGAEARSYYAARFVSDIELVEIVAGGDDEKFEIQCRLGFPVYDPEKSIAPGRHIGDWGYAGNWCGTMLGNGPLRVRLPYSRWRNFPLDAFLSSAKASIDDFREQLALEVTRAASKPKLREVVKTVADAAEEQLDKIVAGVPVAGPGESLLGRTTAAKGANAGTRKTDGSDGIVPAKGASPWAQMFPDGLIKAGQKAGLAKKDYSPLEGKFVGVYRSASWCGPCRIFTPNLVKFYAKNKKNLEIVFVTADETEDAMKKYVKAERMKWLAVPFGSTPNVDSGGGIPDLLIFSPNGRFFKRISGSGKTPDPRLAELGDAMHAWLAEREKNSNSAK